MARTPVQSRTPPLTLIRPSSDRGTVPRGRGAWGFGASVRGYRELEAGERMPNLETYERICELYVWPQTFVASRVQLII